MDFSFNHHHPRRDLCWKTNTVWPDDWWLSDCLGLNSPVQWFVAVNCVLSRLRRTPCFHSNKEYQKILNNFPGTKYCWGGPCLVPRLHSSYFSLWLCWTENRNIFCCILLLPFVLDLCWCLYECSSEMKRFGHLPLTFFDGPKKNQWTAPWKVSFLHSPLREKNAWDDTFTSFLLRIFTKSCSGWILKDKEQMMKAVVGRQEEFFVWRIIFRQSRLLCLYHSKETVVERKSGK